MKIINSAASIGSIVESFKKQGKSVGFIPTMGALHEGHLSLVAKSKVDNSVTVVSIFVNPTQFNDSEDLKNYPRTLEIDSEKLEASGVDYLFVPSVEEMYPVPDTRVFDFGSVDKVMEGAHRPGHFNGVAQIVSKLFDVVKPDRAYFGEKDFQQIAIIRQMVIQLNYSVQIISCPIIRETDGLAMSSRNRLLNVEQRKSSVVISKTLFDSRSKMELLSVEELKAWIIQTIDKNPELKVEYFEIVDDTYLQPVISWNEPTRKVGCIAVKVGKIRLIDNIKYNS